MPPIGNPAGFNKNGFFQRCLPVKEKGDSKNRPCVLLSHLAVKDGDF